MALPETAVADLAEKLGALGSRAAQAALKREFMDLYSISPSTLSRRLTAIGRRSHERRDRGLRRKGVSDEELLKVAALQRKSLSLRKGVIMPAEDAIDIAVDSGLLAPESVSPAYYNEWLRRRHGSRRQQKREAPHVELQSLGPNHVHQLDFSLAVNWKVFQGAPKYEHLIYKNKLPSAGQPQLWRVIVTDHASGAFFVWYAESAGETVQATLEALYRAWAPKPEVEDKYGFRGVPHTLMVDRGPANRAGVTVRLLERLGVKLNVCEGARSKGQVEVSHRFWEEHFESRMRLEPPTSVEQLNAWALDFAVKLCGLRTHTRHGMARSVCWAWFIGRRPETLLREISCGWDAFKSIALSDPKRCLVSGSRIVRFRSERYRVPDSIAVSSYVLAQYSPFDFPKIQVRDDVPGAPTWICEPVEVNEFGFAKEAAVIGQKFKSCRDTPTETFVKDAEQAADELTAPEAKPLQVFGHHAAKAPAASVRPKGKEIETGGEKPDALYTRVQARSAVLERIGRPFTAPEVAYLARRFGAQVAESEVAAAVEAIAIGVVADVVEIGGLDD